MKLQSVLAGRGANDTIPNSSCLLHSPLKPDRNFGHAPKIFTLETTTRRSSVPALKSSEAPMSREPAGNIGIEADGKDKCSASAHPGFHPLQSIELFEP